MAEFATFCIAKGSSTLSDYDNLHERTKLILKETGPKVDNLIFHEGNITEEQQSYIKRGLVGVKFVSIQEQWDKLPDTVHIHAFNGKLRPAVAGLDAATDSMKRWPIGYRRMCAFYSYMMWDYLSGYDYVIRVDADVLLQSKLLHGLDQMKVNKWVLGVPQYLGDTHTLSRTMFKSLLTEYTDQRSMKQWPLLGKEKMPYTPVTFFETAFWKSEPVQKMLDVLRTSHYCIDYRIGDMLPYAAALDLFAGQRYGVIESLSYRHLSSSGSRARIMSNKGSL